MELDIIADLLEAEIPNTYFCEMPNFTNIKTEEFIVLDNRDIGGGRNKYGEEWLYFEVIVGTDNTLRSKAIMEQIRVLLHKANKQHHIKENIEIKGFQEVTGVQIANINQYKVASITFKAFVYNSLYEL